MICIICRNPEAKEQARQLLEELKKGSSQTEIELLFMDETTLRLDPVLRACWMKVGQQSSAYASQLPEKELSCPPEPNDGRADEVTWTVADWKDSRPFHCFLEHLLIEKVSDQKVILVLDRASFHRSAASLAALSLFEHRVRVFWLPSYCTELTPMSASGVI